ncbi:E3 ubiquitin-protein ligase RNF212B-like [Antedon mediterranea]|uniref:E3 ubiquitin-protein ligase RNF212B-like n=1 Tax=Antedon mediterranea TaxID=105859 RepID=UPI003AF425F1
MADWVHCNHCFNRPGATDLRFFLTNCAHIFCQVCIGKVTSTNKCRKCEKDCTVIPLTSQLKPEVQIFFQDPCDILRKHHKQMIQILEFQQNHTQSLANHQKQQRLSQTSVLTEAKKGLQKLSYLENEIKHLSNENNHLRKLLEESPLKRRRSTPSGRHLSSPSPIRMMSLSQTSTPNNMGSPYSPYKLKINRPQDMHHSSQLVRTPQGPARISLRTPPINGRLVTTPGSGLRTPTRTSSYPKRPSTTPGGSLELPITSGFSQPASPMITSPKYRSGGDNQLGGGRGLMTLPQSQPCQSQIRRYMMDNKKYTPKYSESNKTPIQLGNSLHRPLISTPHSSQLPRN